MKKTDITTASRGVLLAFSSGFFISGVNALTKFMKNIDVAQLALCRCWIAASLSLSQIIWQKKDIIGPPPGRVTWVCASLTSATAIVFHCITFRYLPLGQGAVLIASAPAFVTIASRIFLKEKFGLLHVVSVLATTAGMVFTTGAFKAITGIYTNFSTENSYGLLFAFVTVISSVAAPVLIRKIKHVHVSAILFSSGVMGVVESLSLVGLLGSFSLPATDLQRGIIILFAVLSYLGLMCSICSFYYLEAGPAQTMRFSSEVLFSFIWQVIVFSNVPDGMTILGAVLVCSSIFLVGFSERLKNLCPERWGKVCC